ncbi:MAG: nitroreductase family deazaflavin-dependent oxidoreductase [Promicromonosporaceae bacterium]|nr:nitroreductase family deazaflavin-dependent oxidoreductase [Promicromonosporaceae bacterium]
MPTAPRPIRVAIAWVSRTRWFRRVGPKVMPPLERVLSCLTGGRLVASGLIMPSLVLHTVGAKTGKRRSNELMCVPDGETLLITGSNFAGAKHPGWTYNLLANPQAEIDYRGRKNTPVGATLVPDDEREAAWVTLQRQWPNYRRYEIDSGRKLRIFRLTRSS